MVSNLTNHSAIDGDYPQLEAEPQPDANLFPLYYQARKIECTLNPGDMLYIPKGWWHWIFSQDEAIAVNFWFNTQSTTSVNQLQLDICNRTIDQDIFQQQYLAKNQPLLIKHGGKNWPAITLWQRDYLANKKDLIIPQFFSGLGQHSSFAPVDKPCWKNSETFSSRCRDRNNKIKLFPQIGFQKLCQKINEDPQLNYVAFIPLSTQSSLLADLTKPYLLERQDINSINFWYSYGKLHTGLHYDDYENILVLVKGTKRVFLYPPNQGKFLYSQTLPMLFNSVAVENR